MLPSRSALTQRAAGSKEETALAELLPPATDSVGVYLLRYKIALISAVVKSIDEAGKAGFLVNVPLQAVSKPAGPRDEQTNACAALRPTVPAHLVGVIVRLLDLGLNALLHRVLQLLVQRGVS